MFFSLIQNTQFFLIIHSHRLINSFLINSTCSIWNCSVREEFESQVSFNLQFFIIKAFIKLPLRFILISQIISQFEMWKSWKRVIKFCWNENFPSQVKFRVFLARKFSILNKTGEIENQQFKCSKMKWNCKIATFHALNFESFTHLSQNSFAAPVGSNFRERPSTVLECYGAEFRWREMRWVAVL